MLTNLGKKGELNWFNLLICSIMDMLWGMLYKQSWKLQQQNSHGILK